MRIAVLTLLALALPRAASAGVVINEFLPDAAGADPGWEWVELYNGGASSVDLSGWSLWRATQPSNWSSSYTLPSGTVLGAGEFLVIGDEFTGADLLLPPGETLNLGNAGTNGHAVRLEDGLGAIVDTVVYGPNNNQGFLDDTGSVATSTAPTPIVDQSLARAIDGVDTDQSGDDFIRLSPPTPGLTNQGSGPVDPDCPVTTGRVVINELLPNPAGADAGYEWIELYNAGSESADLTEWVVSRATSGNFGVRFTFPEGTTLLPDEHLLVGDWLVLQADFRTEEGTSLNLGNAGSTGDSVRIEDCNRQVVDTIVYGPNNDHGFLEDDGSIATVLAPTPLDDQSLARWADGEDTDRSGDDFLLTPDPSPGLPNPQVVPPLCEPGAAGSVVINELLSDPEGPDAGHEWVELYNPGDEPVRLDDWRIQRAKNATQGWGTRFIFPSESWIAPGEHLLIADWLVSGADYALPDETSLDLGNATSAGNGVRLDDCEDQTIDTVLYGPNNEHGFVEDSGEVATDLPAAPRNGQSLARIEDGYDTDVSGHDFTVLDTPTPGASNPVTEPMICVPSPGGLVINELLSDPEGPDAGFEWFELYNSSDQPISIAGWYVSMASQPDHYGRVDVSFPAGTTVGPGEWFVVGDEQVDGADLTHSMNIYNGTNGAAMRLFDCEHQTVDTVVYGSNNDNELRDDNEVVAEPAVKPPSGRTLARAKDGVDTDSPSDWVAAIPTPGASNAVDGIPGGGDKPGGCNQRDTPGERRGCSTVPLPLGGLEMLLALLALRRRRE